MFCHSVYKGFHRPGLREIDLVHGVCSHVPDRPDSVGDHLSVAAMGHQGRYESYMSTLEPKLDL